MATPMMRGTGSYVVINGKPVTAHLSREGIRAIDKEDGNRFGPVLSRHEYERVEDVVVTASWRGGRVTVDRLSDDPAGGRLAEIWTEDRALAQREGMDGEQYSGWRSKVAVTELTDVHERVKVREIG